jgi:hypothetical protein
MNVMSVLKIPMVQIGFIQINRIKRFIQQPQKIVMLVVLIYKLLLKIMVLLQPEQH